MPRRRGGCAEDEKGHERRREPEREAHRRDLLEREPEGEEAAEDGAERPETGRPEREECRLHAVQRDVERARERHQPRPGETRDEEEAEAGPRALPEDRRGEQHRDERLDLLQDDRGHRVSVHERLREQDRRERRRARADDDARRHVARASAPQRREGGHDHREQDEDEHDVLAEHDRRGLRRLREWTAQQRVGPPQPSRDGDGNDTDGRRSQLS